MKSKSVVYALFATCFYGDELLAVYAEEDDAREAKVKIGIGSPESYYVLAVKFIEGK